MVEPTVRDRIAGKVQVTSGGCWMWTAAKNAYGYGVMGVPGTRSTALAHRLAFEVWRGPIPEGCDLDHLCRNRSCANPDHLDPVTRRVNLLRGETVTAANAAKMACPQGHPYAGTNLIIRMKAGKPTRRCRACDLARKAEDRRRRAAD